MSARRPTRITARGVRTILTREGVDHSALTVVDDPQVWTDLATGRQGTSVLIEGLREARRAAFHVLFHRGYAVAPYPDRDYWSAR